MVVTKWVLEQEVVFALAPDPAVGAHAFAAAASAEAVILAEPVAPALLCRRRLFENTLSLWFFTKGHMSGSGRRGGRFAAGAAALLGLVAAVVLVGMRSPYAGGGAPRSVELVEQAAQMRARQLRALAAGNGRFAHRLAGKVRFSMLDSDEEEDAAETGDAANFTDCNSWRGCYMMREQYDINGTTEILPEQVQFECGGAGSTEICYNATMSCLDSAESFAEMLYKVSPFEGSEMRTKSSCRCFSSNGCRPSCNVVLYQRWSANTGINCPATPPIFHEESGVYQYGDADASYVAPNDYSFDYYPEYPNPAGHVYDAPWARNTYESEPGIGMYQTPLLARIGGDDGMMPPCPCPRCSRSLVLMP